MKKYIGIFSLFSLGIVACDDVNSVSVPNINVNHVKFETIESKILGENDNAESVKFASNEAFYLTSSKARKLSRFEITDKGLKETDNRTFVKTEGGENELTNLDVAKSGDFIAMTETVIVKKGEKQQDCKGNLIVVGKSESGKIGKDLQTIEVGPMPDAVAISPNEKWIVVANEGDFKWGKCKIYSLKPSISVLKVTKSPEFKAEKVADIVFDLPGVSKDEIEKSDDVREPEYVAISADSDTVAVTLQDSHEIAVFKISDIVKKAEKDGKTLKADALSIFKLPPNSLKQNAWPDSIIALDHIAGKKYFAVAGEWNDVIYIIDADKNVISQIALESKNIPSTFPFVEKEHTPKFSPDTLAYFSKNAHHYVVASLRHAGAIIVYNVDDVTKPTFVSAVKVGREEKGADNREKGSSVRPEGIATSADGNFIATANEKENTVSLVKIK